jgi:uncharacterized OsmC-like protein
MENYLITYSADLRTKAVHLRSEAEIITDAPVDNQGKGQAFSPTDLLAVSLGTCILTTMGIMAQNHGFSIDGTELKVAKIMGDKPRRVSEIILEFYFPEIPYDEKQKTMLEHITKACPVGRSLHPDLKQTVAMHFQK